MSVYHEALASGRLTLADIAAAGGSFPRALRKVKRVEAEKRNEATPVERRAWFRRDAAARVEKKAAAKAERKAERKQRREANRG